MLGLAFVIISIIGAVSAFRFAPGLAKALGVFPPLLSMAAYAVPLLYNLIESPRHLKPKFIFLTLIVNGIGAVGGLILAAVFRAPKVAAPK
jgi:hypothetical protein